MSPTELTTKLADEVFKGGRTQFLVKGCSMEDETSPDGKFSHKSISQFIDEVQSCKDEKMNALRVIEESRRAEC